ncbi:hypothetical protein Tco_0026533 [Tanacetum coccineum]
MKSGQLTHLVKGIKKGMTKASDSQQGDSKKGSRETALVEAPILMINRKDHTSKRKLAEEPVNGLREIIFSLVLGVNNSFDPLKPSIKSLRVDSKVPLVGFSREHSWPIEKVSLEITIGDSPFTRTETLNFVIVRSNVNVFAWTQADMTGILRTIMVGGKPFNMDNKLNEYKHIKPVKQKKRGLGLDRSKAACKEVEELMKAGIL